jgi:D-lyxose ketol-isomerase
MKRSEINRILKEAQSAFLANGWALPPNPKWDITDFGLDDFNTYGLVLINLAEEPEYCEKLMYARKSQKTPAHMHRKKKEDIICRKGRLTVQIWNGPPENKRAGTFQIKVNGQLKTCNHGDTLTLASGERVTLTPGVYHEFYPESDHCIIGEVSTANDDLHDNFFVDPKIARFSDIDEDEPPMVKLLSDR